MGGQASSCCPTSREYNRSHAAGQLRHRSRSRNLTNRAGPDDKEHTMSKARDTKKTVKKEPTKTLKEKREAKKGKKEANLHKQVI
jgi:hypothetical protein